MIAMVIILTNIPLERIIENKSNKQINFEVYDNGIETLCDDTKSNWKI